MRVSSLGLVQAPDIAVREFAKSNGFAIVSADADFYELATTLGHPPKVIWLRGCDCPTVLAEGLIRNHAIRMVELLRESEQAVLILKK